MRRYLELLLKALRTSSILSTDTGVGLALIELGASLHRGGKEEEAIESFEESLRLLRATGERWRIAYALLWLGDPWFRLRDIERAATGWEESLRLTQELGDHYLMAWSLSGLADVARLRADYKRVTGMFKQALSYIRAQEIRSPHRSRWKRWGWLPLR